MSCSRLGDPFQPRLMYVGSTIYVSRIIFVKQATLSSPHYSRCRFSAPTMSTQTIIQILLQSQKRLSTLPIASTWFINAISSPGCFPALPNELVHLIFILAAADCRETCFTLCIVSSWARNIVLPYHSPTLAIIRPKHFLNDPTSMHFHSPSGPWVYPVAKTRHLWIGSALDSSYMSNKTLADKIAVILSCCSSLAHVAVSGAQMLAMAEEHLDFPQPRLDLILSTARDSEMAALFGVGSTLHSHFNTVTSLTLPHINRDVLVRFSLNLFPRIEKLRIDLWHIEKEDVHVLLLAVQNMASLRELILSLAGASWIMGQDGEKEIIKMIEQNPHRLCQVRLERPKNWDYFSWQEEMSGNGRMESFGSGYTNA